MMTFEEMNYEIVDMTSLVIIGNKSTFMDKGYMITPRGYVL